MKTIRFGLYAILLAMLIAACQPANPPVPQPNEPSMKGYELYSWEEDGRWYFSVLVGTNRKKTLEEIQAPEAVLAGIEELQAVLEQIPAGESVVWWKRDGLAFPPEEVIARVEDICGRQGLALNIAR